MSPRTIDRAWDASRRAVRRFDLRFHDLGHSGLTWSGGSEQLQLPPLALHDLEAWITSRTIGLELLPSAEVIDTPILSEFMPAIRHVTRSV